MDYRFWKENDFDTVLEATREEFPIGCLVSTLGGTDCWEVCDYTGGAVDENDVEKVFVELRSLDKNNLTSMSPFCFAIHKDDMKMTKQQLSRLRKNTIILSNMAVDFNRMRRVLHEYEDAPGMIDNLESLVSEFSQMTEDYERIAEDE